MQEEPPIDGENDTVHLKEVQRAFNAITLCTRTDLREVNKFRLCISQCDNLRLPCRRLVNRVRCGDLLVASWMTVSMKPPPPPPRQIAALVVVRKRMRTMRRLPKGISDGRQRLRSSKADCQKCSFPIKTPTLRSGLIVQPSTEWPTYSTIRRRESTSLIIL